MNKSNLLHKIILLADDDPDDAEMFADVLSELDSSVRFCHVKDGLAVFEFLKSSADQKPDAIFLDINMPEMNGWQCLSSLKNDPLTRDIPVLMYSTSSHQRDKQTAKEFGASAFITKPSDYSTLRQILSPITEGLSNGVKTLS
jgi:CheY-like chemotaxis protein